MQILRIALWGPRFYTLPMQTVSQTLAAHRSIRQFQAAEIPQDVIEAVLGEAVAGTSSSGNLNSYSLVLTRDSERRQKLYELHEHQDMILQAPLLITFCADWYRTRAWLKLRGARDNFDNFLGYHIAVNDTMLLSQSVALGFEARGYGLCYLGSTLRATEELAELLELPETCLPVTTVAVGLPAENPQKRERLPLHAFIHNETYQRPSEAELADIYAAREESGWRRYMTEPRLKAMCEEGGITSLAQMYTSPYKYDPAAYRQRSQEMLKVLQRRGFLPEELQLG